MFVRWMRIMICAILVVAIIGSSFSAEAAGDLRIILKLRVGALLGPILALLGADVLDSIPSINLYLLRVPHLPVLNFTLSLLGVIYIENDTTLSNPTFRNMGLLDSVAPADFYRRQPALTLIRADNILDYYDGYGVIVADINSATDFNHP